MQKIAQNRSLAPLLLAAIVLVLTQLGAMHHAYSHVPQAAAGVQDSNFGAHSSCDECLSFAPLLSSSGSPDIIDFAAPPARAIALRATSASLLNNRLALAFRSRAPPVAA